MSRTELLAGREFDSSTMGCDPVPESAHSSSVCLNLGEVLRSVYLERTAWFCDLFLILSNLGMGWSKGTVRRSPEPFISP